MANLRCCSLRRFSHYGDGPPFEHGRPYRSGSTALREEALPPLDTRRAARARLLHRCLQRGGPTASPLRLASPSAVSVASSIVRVAARAVGWCRCSCLQLATCVDAGATSRDRPQPGHFCAPSSFPAPSSCSGRCSDLWAFRHSSALKLLSDRAAVVRDLPDVDLSMHKEVRGLFGVLR